MVKRSYVPGNGEIVWLTFNPQVGHEQAGRRPALALSPRSYNRKTGLTLFCPITSRAKGYPFEVALPASGAVTGVVLADQIKSPGLAGQTGPFRIEGAGPRGERSFEKLAVLLDQNES